MGSNILSVGKSAVLAAQVGIATTAHNISNSATPGFNRQTVVQGTAQAQDGVGGGTRIEQINRVYNEFLGGQVRTAQTSKGALDSYFSQVSQITNMLADPSAGLSPALQDFFKGVQDLSANPNSVAARQAVLSGGDELAGRFQSMNNRLEELRSGVNSQITSSITVINSYAEQIASLNDSIATLSVNANKPPNDLLDQRDQVISELSKEVKVAVLTQSDGSYTVSIGNGQPLVVGSQVFSLVPTTSPTDLSRVQVGFVANGTTVVLPETTLTGGRLGGFFDFRSRSLDVTQNSLGLVAAGLTNAFNAQHKLGQDQNGAIGGDFFTVTTPDVNPSTANNLGTNAIITAAIDDASLLTASDYRLQMTAGAYSLLRLSDNTVLSSTTFAAAQAAAVTQGFTFTLASGSFTTGDNFVIRPTANAAGGFGVEITDKAAIAAAAPIRTTATTANAGSGAITPGVVSATDVIPALTLSYNLGTGQLSGFPSTLPVTVTTAGVPTTYAAGLPVNYTTGDIVTFGDTRLSGIPIVTGSYSVGIPSTTLTYDSGTNTLSGFPPYLDVSVTNNGVATAGSPFAAGTPVTYTAGATVSFGGVSFTISGTPADNDTFTVGPNSSGLGDNRNALLLGALQSSNTLYASSGGNPTASFQSAYAQLVSAVGNKAREVQVTGSAADKLLAQVKEAQQSESGVNLDEEATNLLRYQQAYQAAGKVMQVAGTLFDVLLSLGR